MVKIRLARFGSKKRPYYHIVVADSEARRDGRFLEQVGTYNPSRPIQEVKLDLERVGYWLSVGAQPTLRVRKVINELKRAEPLVPVEAAPVEAAPVEAPAESPAQEPAAEADSVEQAQA